MNIKIRKFEKAVVLWYGEDIYFSYDGDLGLITDASPQGNAGSVGLENSLVVSAYVPGSHQLDATFNATLTQWNTSTSEIRSTRMHTNHFDFQSQYNATVGGAKIPNDNTPIANLSWRISWDRKP